MLLTLLSTISGQLKVILDCPSFVNATEGSEKATAGVVSTAAGLHWGVASCTHPPGCPGQYSHATLTLTGDPLALEGNAALRVTVTFAPALAGTSLLEN